MRSGKSLLSWHLNLLRLGKHRLFPDDPPLTCFLTASRPQHRNSLQQCRGPEKIPLVHPFGNFGPEKYSPGGHALGVQYQSPRLMRGPDKRRFYGKEVKGYLRIEPQGPTFCFRQGKTGLLSFRQTPLLSTDGFHQSSSGSSGALVSLMKCCAVSGAGIA